MKGKLVPDTGRRALLCAAATSLPLAAWAQAASARSVKMIVPSAPGSSTDLTSRIYAEGLRKELEQAIVVENRAGASGTIGSVALAAAPPDGGTIGLLTVGMLAINPYLYPNLRYDPNTDFTPIAFGGFTPSILVVHHESPYQSVDDIVKAARQSPGKLNYASSGNGTTSHVAGEIIKNHAGVDIQHIPFKSGAGLNALLGAQVDFTFYHPIAVLPHVRDGKLRALAVSSARPISDLPGVKPMAEQGFPGFDLTAWYAFMGPKGMSPDVLDRYTRAVGGALDQANVQAQLAEQGVEIERIYGDKLAIFIKAEQEKWGRLIRETGATLG